MKMNEDFSKHIERVQEYHAYIAAKRRREKKIKPVWIPSPISLPARKIGGVAVRHRIVEDETPIIGHRQAFMRSVRPAMAKLTNPLRVHELWSSSHGIWMTDLPEELFQIHEMIERVRPWGRVLVGGLGLGIVAKSLSSQGIADSVTVIERDARVIELAAQPGYEVVKADIFDYLRKSNAQFDHYLLDTWQGTSEATWWEEVMPMRRVIRNRWGRRPRIHCWAEDIMVGQIMQTIYLGNGRPSRGWHMEGLPQTMTLPEIDWFLSNVGTPKWERLYGSIYPKKGTRG